MAERREQEERTATIGENRTWIAGGVGGLVAGVVMGVLLQVVMTPVIASAIPALYGASGLVAGWAAHLFHSVVFGLVYAALASFTSLSRYADDATTGAGLGIAYGVVVWVVAAAFVMPYWLGAVGFPGAPPLPNFNPMSLVGRVVFGLVLGVVYAYVGTR